MTAFCAWCPKLAMILQATKNGMPHVNARPVQVVNHSLKCMIMRERVDWYLHFTASVSMSTKGSTHFTGDIAMPSRFSEKALSHITTHTSPNRNAAALSRAIRNPPSPLLLLLEPHRRPSPRPRIIRPPHGSGSGSETVARPSPPPPIDLPLLTPRADRLRPSLHRGPSATSPPPPPPPSTPPPRHTATSATALWRRRRRSIDSYAAARPTRAARRPRAL